MPNDRSNPSFQSIPSLRDMTTAGLLAEVEHWRLLLAEISLTPNSDAEIAAGSQAYVAAKLHALTSEANRRRRLSRHPAAPPWPDVASREAERDAVKDRLPLLEAVQDHVPWPLVKRGGSWWCCCPLPGHDEETASFHVDPVSNVFWCFGCQRGGDVFEFIRLLLSVDGFPQVMQVARIWAGMPEPTRPAAKPPARAVPMAVRRVDGTLGPLPLRARHVPGDPL